jgi:hypothetical protein
MQLFLHRYVQFLQGSCSDSNQQQAPVEDDAATILNLEEALGSARTGPRRVPVFYITRRLSALVVVRLI